MAHRVDRESRVRYRKFTLDAQQIRCQAKVISPRQFPFLPAKPRTLHLQLNPEPPAKCFSKNMHPPSVVHRNNVERLDLPSYGDPKLKKYRFYLYKIVT